MEKIQIVPWSFLDTDGDGRGNLNGISNKLDSISALGVDAIWLTPIYESPMDDLGYDITHMINIDPVIGDLDVFDKLLTLTHARGLRMIVDPVGGISAIASSGFGKAAKAGIIRKPIGTSGRTPNPTAPLPTTGSPPSMVIPPGPGNPSVNSSMAVNYFGVMQTPNNWWRNAVIYQIYPRSFADSNGDGIGDLPGILNKLDYVASLGVDAIWISPFFQSPMKDFGYDISDYQAVDPIFGTLEDFQAVLQAAHDRHLKVLIDQVWNHTSDEHPWFWESRSSRDNPKADWYVWADPKPDGTAPNNWLSTFGGSAWAWEPQRQQYYLHNFLASQPDLNWYNPEVVEAILDTARFWLDLGVDGFRLDVVNFFTCDRSLRDNPLRPPDMPGPDGAAASDPFFAQINLYNFCQSETLELLKPIRQVMDSYGDTTTLAEISSAEDTLAVSSEYVRGRDRLHTAYNSSLMTDAPLTAQRVTELIQRVETLFGDGVICWTAGTHDFPRLKSRWSKYQPSEAFLQDAFDHMFAALIISLRGSCCLYQGDELGLTQAHIPFEKMQDPFGIQGYPHILGRDGSRTPMPWYQEAPHAGFTTAIEPWLPIPPEHQALAVDVQETQPGSLLQKYRRLLHWRKQQPALRQGQLQLLEFPDKLVGFMRECADQRLLCIFNLSPETVYQDLSTYQLYEPVEELGFVDRTYQNTLELPSFGVFFANLRYSPRHVGQDT